MDTKAVDSIDLVAIQIKAFNEGYELGRKVAEQIYK